MGTETEGNPLATGRIVEKTGKETRADALSEQEQRLQQVWSEQDRQEYRRKVSGFEEIIGQLRGRIEEIRMRGDSIWDYFVSLALEKITKQQLPEFLRELQKKVDTLTPLMVEATTSIDKLTSDIAGYQRLLGKKAAVLESMTHRISTHNHLHMMISRVAGLEQHLSGKEPPVERHHENSSSRSEVNVLSDLLYLRVRLRTTRSATLAARYTKQVADANPALYSLLFRADRLRADLVTVATRMACLHDQVEYWQAFLDMPESNDAFLGDFQP